MAMSDNSPEKGSEQPELFPTASLADFHVKTCRSPDEERALMESEAVYGESLPASLARFDHATSSWRTWQLCLVEGLEPFLGTWPRSGMMRSGIAYQLAPLVPLTDETVSGYWPTPTVVYTRANWEPERIRARQAEVKAETLAKGKHHTDNGFGLNLAQAVRMWPTPNAGDYKAGMSNAPGRQQSSLPRTVGIVEGVSSGKRGGLNPTWVEWLMGFPTEWSAFVDSETP
jgi:DNA (cytosine-5)-methyltransferase 1